MLQSELILEYIDGTIDAETEQGLFDDMARHPELRAELRHYINIGDAVRSDREAFAPPAYVERSLMAGLGLVPVGGDIGGVAAVGGGFLARFGFGKLGAMIAGFVLGALLAGSGVYLATESQDSDRTIVAGNDGQESSTSAAEKNQGPPTETSVSGSTATGSLPLVPPTLATENRSNAPVLSMNSSGASDDAPSVARSVRSSRLEVDAKAVHTDGGRSDAVRSLNNGGSVDRVSSSPSGASHSRAVSDATMLPVVDSVADVSEVEVHASDARVEPSAVDSADGAVRAVEAPANLPAPWMRASGDDPSIAENRGWIVEGRYLLGTSALRTKAREVDQSLPENLALGFYGEVNNNLYIGLEGGVERYAQTLYFNNQDTLAIDQNPRYVWGGLAVRYQFPGRIPLVEFQPYFQVTGGYTQAGPLVRLRFAFSWDVASGVRITPGIEASSLLYTFNRQQLVSGRYGGTLGVEWKLPNLW